MTDISATNPSLKSDSQESPDSLSWAQRIITPVVESAANAASAVSEKLSSLTISESDDSSRPAGSKDVEQSTKKNDRQSVSTAASLRSSSSSSTGHHDTSESMNLHDHDNDEHADSTAASSVVEENGEAIQAQAASAKPAPLPPVNVWEVRKKQMAQSQSSSSAPSDHNAASNQSDGKATNLPAGLTNGAANPTIGKSGSGRNPATGDFIPRSKMAAPRSVLPPLQDANSWPSPVHERETSTSSERSTSKVSQSSESNKGDRKKAKWIPLHVDITVKAPGRRTSGMPNSERRKLPNEQTPTERRSREISEQKPQSSAAKKSSAQTSSNGEETSKDSTSSTLAEHRQAAPFVPRNLEDDSVPNNATTNQTFENNNSEGQRARPVQPVNNRNDFAFGKRGRGGKAPARGMGANGRGPPRPYPRNDFGHQHYPDEYTNGPAYYHNPYEFDPYNGHPQHNYYQAAPYFYDPMFAFGFDPNTPQYERPEPIDAHLLGSPPMDWTSYFVLGQIEFYMSDDNLARDSFLREQMDAEGWVALVMISTFNRIRALSEDLELIKGAVERSTRLEMREDRVRRRGDWYKWAQKGANDTKSQSLNANEQKAGTALQANIETSEEKQEIVGQSEVSI